MAEAIREEGERLNRFVQNLLDMTRLGYGALRLNLDWVDLREVMGRATRQLGPVLRDHPVDIAVPASLGPIHIDAILMEQVMANLLDNAAKYAPAGTPITVAARRDGREVVIETSDAGPGIPPEDRERVFDMFYRVRAGDGQRAGTGLGLAICRGIVEAHGGRIKVGTLRAAAPGSRSGCRPRASLPPAGAGGDAVTEAAGKVLVVDDEAQIRRFLRIALEAHGFTVAEAIRGQDAVARTASENPDVVILDLGLPDMDGKTVVARIREWSSVPILILSVRQSEAEKVAALDAGADDYVVKPFGIAELLARLRALRRNRRTDAGPSEPAELTVGDLRIDLARREVQVAGNPVRLTRKEFDLLAMLARNAGRIVTHPQLLRAVWGRAHENDVHYLRVFVGQIREKLADDPAHPRFILNEPGVGYRLLVP